MIYTVRTTSGRETIVIDMLESKVRAEKLDIKTIFHPAEIKGYIFIEGSSGEVQKAIRGVMHVRGLIEKPIGLGEIQRFLEQKREVVTVGIGDTVEIIGGPFKGEKGKINRIDPVKREVTVELLEATIPIPVTIATEFVKVLKVAAKEVKIEKKPEEKPEEEKPSVFEGIGEGAEKAEEEPVIEEEAPEEPEKAEEPQPEPEKEEPEAAEKPEEPIPAPEPEKEEEPQPVPEEPKEQPSSEEAKPEEPEKEKPETEEENMLIAELEKKKKKKDVYDEED